MLNAAIQVIERLSALNVMCLSADEGFLMENKYSAPRWSFICDPLV